MSNKAIQIKVLEGPLAGGCFDVPASGLRLGRSSTCEVSIPDPSLSRNHCLFEIREGGLWVTDLASANGTYVNDSQLGTDACALAAGDVVTVGDSRIEVVVDGDEGAAALQTQKVDLGLGRPEGSSGTEEAAKTGSRRLVLWLLAAAAVAGAAAVILSSRPPAVVDAAPKELAKAAPRLYSLAFEKVEANVNGIYRYALSLDRAGVMTVEIDDIPKENRHVRKSAALSSNAVERLSKMLSSPELYKLSSEYTGVPLEANTLKSFSLRVVRGNRVFAISIENTQEPEEFQRVREQLETFSKNELGIWAIQFSSEKLVEMSAEARRTGDAKWQERDVQHGNVAAALAAYDEAIYYLETVNPKPADFGALAARRQEAFTELEKRYRDQRFLADRAINLQDWNTALRELRVLCEMVPDAKDPRHSEASSKLLDVEQRIKKGVK